MTITENPTHPRISERRAAVEVQSLRSRNRKLIAAAVVAFAGLLGAAATQSPLLDVDEVRIVGAVRSAPESLRELAGVELGTPLMGLDHREIESRLAVLPSVAQVSSSSTWGGVVTIEIAERLPVAQMVSPEGVVVIAGDGVVLEIAAEPTPGLPTVSGVMFSTEAGATVPTALEDALTVAGLLPSDIATVTERVEITVDSLMLRLVGGGSVALGDARELETKLDAVRAFLAQVDLSCLDSLNVQAPRVPVIVRLPNCG